MSNAMTFNGRPMLFGRPMVFGRVTPPGPSLPAYTLRLRFTDGTTPTNNKGTLTQVSSSPNVWDWTYINADWTSAWTGNTLLEVIDGNTSDVTNIRNMFYNCTALTSVPLFDTSNVTNMRSMFQNCYSLTSVPLFDTSKVTTMYMMFQNCYSLTSVPLFDTSKVTTMYMMFRYCNALTTVPLFDTSNVSTMSNMFYNCTALTSVPLFDTSKVTDMSNMFNGCTNVESGALALYQQASTQTTPPLSHVSTFKDCGSNTTTGAAELAQIPTSWGGTAS